MFSSEPFVPNLVPGRGRRVPVKGATVTPIAIGPVHLLFLELPTHPCPRDGASDTGTHLNPLRLPREWSSQQHFLTLEGTFYSARAPRGKEWGLDTRVGESWDPSRRLRTAPLLLRTHGVNNHLI